VNFYELEDFVILSDLLESSSPHVCERHKEDASQRQMSHNRGLLLYLNEAVRETVADECLQLADSCRSSLFSSMIAISLNQFLIESLSMGKQSDCSHLNAPYPNLAQHRLLPTTALSAAPLQPSGEALQCVPIPLLTRALQTPIHRALA
jgi:hypothetical protein